MPATQFGIQLTDDLRPPKLVENPEDRMKDLVAKTKIVAVQDNIPLQRYFHSGKEMLRMANTYLDEKDYENAFVLYMKYMTLFVEKLPSHCQYKNPKFDVDKKKVLSLVKKLLLISDEIKTKIKKKYKEEYEEYMMKKKEYDEKLEQAQKELMEQRKKDQANKHNEMHNDFVANFQTQIDLKKRELAEKKEKMEKSKIEVKTDDEDNGGSSTESSTASNTVVVVPGSSQPVPRTTRKPPVFDRSTKPSISLLNDASGDLLRKLIVPFKALTDKFIRLAQKNTDNNVETCGILCGQLKRDRFTITHILVPRQTGTSDSCTSINEEDLALEQEKYNLITMGWIHTHPTQRSFLSSIDLHTHALYQKMLPEAIAMVVAPTTDEIRMYSLTDHGLEFILKCTETGFHPHSNEQSLYQESDHILVDDSLSVIVIDLR